MLEQILDILPRAVLVGIAASVTVGPVAIFTIQRTLSRGRNAGIYSALGVSSADTLLAMVSYLFYSLLSRQLDEYSFALSILGGIIVSAIGFSIMMRNPIGQLRKQGRKKSSPWRDFISIAGLTFANFMAVIPYILAFFALFQIQPIERVERAEDIVSSVVVIGGFLVGSLAWWMSMVFGISAIRSQFKLKHLVVISRVAGALILLLGLSTILFTILSPKHSVI